MKQILFLDLEGTIIKTWENPTIINSMKISNFIKHNGFEEIGIFSFAIWNQADGEKFLNEMLPLIEKVLTVKITVAHIPTIETLRRDVMNEFNLAKLSKDDFFCFNNKESAFITFCRRNFKDSNCVLLDDMIWDEIHFSVARKNLTVNTINVNSL